MLLIKPKSWIFVFIKQTLDVFNPNLPVHMFNK